MKTLLINPKFPYYRGGDLFPVSLGYLTQIAEKHGQVFVIDMNVDNVKIENEIEKINPDYICLTATTPSFPFAVELLKKIRPITKAKIILGGIHATFLPEECLNYADIVVRGEGEETLDEILSGKELSKVDGITYKENNEIIHNKDRELIKDLDKIGYPVYSKFPLKKYKIISIVTSRGCPFNCSYCCAARFWKNLVRYRSVKSVIEELKQIKKLGFEKIRIHDSTFNLDKERVMKICDEMIKNRFNFKWSCEVRADFLSEYLLKKMKQAGCILICIGVDSASQDVLDKCNRKISVETMKKAFLLANRIDINTRAYVTFGLKGETKESAEETIKFLQEVKPFQITLSLATIYPGTDLCGGKTIDMPSDWIGQFTGHGRLCDLYLPDTLTKNEYKLLADYMYIEVKKLVKSR